MKSIFSILIIFTLAGCTTTPKPSIRQRITEAYRTGERQFSVSFRLLLQAADRNPGRWRMEPEREVASISNVTSFGRPTATWIVRTRRILPAGSTHRLVVGKRIRGLILPERPRHIPFKSEVADILKRYPVPRPKIPTLFIGSSSFRMWRRLESDMAEFGAKNHGFGGSMVWMLNHYYPVLVKPFRPDRVVIYCGENDIAAGISPAEFRKEFIRLTDRLRKNNPKVSIYYCTMKPSPSRKRFLEKFKKANMMIRLLADETPGIFYIDVASPMIDEYGDIRPDIWKPDRLHMNRKGYTTIWIPVIRAALQGRRPPQKPVIEKKKPAAPGTDRW